MPIPHSERSKKFCTKCQVITPWNSHDRCLICQRERSRAYAKRKKASGGDFSQQTKASLIKDNPTKCPACGTPWSEVKKHAQHPDTPWHFDHHVSPQKGGTNETSNARIMCWPCNMKKLNKNPIPEGT